MLAPLFNELTGLQAKHEERPSDSASEPGTSVSFSSPWSEEILRKNYENTGYGK